MFSLILIVSWKQLRRLKITDAGNAGQILPSWDPTHCQQLQTPLQTSPQNCLSRDLCTLTGGSLEDVKVFGNGLEGWAGTQS